MVFISGFTFCANWQNLLLILINDIYFRKTYDRYLIMFWCIFQTKLWNRRLIHSVSRRFQPIAGLTLRSSFCIWVLIGWGRLGLGAASTAVQYVVTHLQPPHNSINLDFFSWCALKKRILIIRASARFAPFGAAIPGGPMQCCKANPTRKPASLTDRWFKNAYEDTIHPKNRGCATPDAAALWTAVLDPILRGFQRQPI